ncbi:MAG: carbohydrate ABC transporter permease [Treponemataceae bacterium]
MNNDIVEKKHIFQGVSKVLSYIIFVSFTVITIAPLVWMTYSSFKTNEELNISMFTMPSQLIFNKDAEFEVINAATDLNIMPDYDIKKDTRERIVIEPTKFGAPGRRVMVYFLVKENMPQNIQSLVIGDKILLKDLPKSEQTRIMWDMLWWNYSSAWTRGALGLKFINSIIYTFAATFFVILLGLMIGYAVSKFKYKKVATVIMAVIGLGYLIDVNQVIIPLFLMLSNLKLTDTHLGIILVYVAFGLPMSVLLSSQFIRGLPSSLVESAYIDGANPFRTFISIIVPMTIPVIVTISIMTGLGIWNEFLLVLVFASSEATKSLPVGIYSFSSKTGQQLGWQVAALIIATLPVVFVYFSNQRKLAEGVAGGALKE